MKRFLYMLSALVLLTVFIFGVGATVELTLADGLICYQGPFTETCNDGPGPTGCTVTAERTDGNVPTYQVGDTATLEIESSCGNAPVYTWRDKDGQTERDGLIIGFTDSNGDFTNSITSLPDQPGVCGVYTNEEYAVGSASNARDGTVSSYTVTGCSP